MMYFIFYLLVIFINFRFNAGLNATNVTENTEAVSVQDVADTLLITLLGSDPNNTRLNELKDKVSKIDSYVVDQTKYGELLLNETKRTDLNETNFYLALLEQDHFQFRNETNKNLYLKLKEKMNRDDILQVLAGRGEKKVMKSARKMMKENYRVKKPDDKALNDVVDKYIGEAPRDDHKYPANDSRRYSQFWDPQAELEERQAYYNPDGRRIFKGERTTVRYYPFMASVHVMGRFWCGGVLYWHDLVITSASCLQLMHNNRFFRENPRALSVRIGSNHSRIGGELIEALEVYFHPSYNPRLLRNNIALIRLRRHIKFNYHRIPKIIQISTEENGMPFTGEVMLLGWGVTKTSQKLKFEPIFLQRKMLPVYPSKFCKDVYGDKFISETMFCAGTITTGEGACDHDAGGPAVMSGKLVGVISFGPTICGFPDVPTVFTLVGAYADWIETVNETMPNYYRGRKRTTTTTEDPFVEYFHTVQYMTYATLPPLEPQPHPAVTPAVAMRNNEISNVNPEKANDDDKSKDAPNDRDAPNDKDGPNDRDAPNNDNEKPVARANEEESTISVTPQDDSSGQDAVR